MNALLAIEEADLKPVLHPAIYVEPRDKNAASEETRQSGWVAMMRRTAKHCLVFAVPNGAKRTRWEANKAKREGLYTGFPDTGVIWRGGAAYPEWKNGTDGPTVAQIETLNWLHARGVNVAVVRTGPGCLTWLASVGAPVPEIRA